MVATILMMAALATHLSIDQPMVALVDRQSLSPELYECKAIALSSDTLLVIIPLEDSKMLGAGLTWIGPLPERQLWIVRRDMFAAERVPSEMVVVQTQTGFVIAADQDVVDNLRNQGLFIVPAEPIAISKIISPGFGERFLEELLGDKPRRVRWQRAREIANLVEPSSIASNLDLLCRDPVSGEPSARFSCRDELEQVYAQLIMQKLEQYLLPKGGTVDTMMFRISQCGQKNLVNIIGSKPGLRTSACYLICAHYDATASLDQGWDWTIDPSPGADDNASGVVSLLECARVLGSVEMDVGVKFVAFSGEEQGLTGSLDYVKRLSQTDSIIGVINLDMIGWVEDQKTAARIRYDWKSKWLADLLEEAKDSLAIDDLELESEIEKMALTSDHASFWIYGIPGVCLSENAAYPYYHTKADTAGNVHIGQVCDLTKLVSGLLGFFISVEGEGLCDLVVQEGNVEFDWKGKAFGRQALLGDSITAIVRAVNQGLAMEAEEPYVFEIWDGKKGSGKLIDRDTVLIQIASGMVFEIKRSWEIQGPTGRRLFTLGLLPLSHGVEDNIDNNIVTVDLIVSHRDELAIQDLHVFPNPVSDGKDIKIGFLLLYSGTSLFATMDVSIYDIMGKLLVTKSFEKLGTRQDFVIGENTIDLGEVLSTSDLSPGLYQLVVSVRSLSPGSSSRASKANTRFAVIR